jgi:signal transduction histidine kinase/ActR/RegA family two-component response regulator
MTNDGPSASPDTLRLLHELQMHQAELAQQNEELKAARNDHEASAQRYFDLYESAPVGLVTLTRRGVVREVNRCSREMLADGDDELAGGCLLDRLADPSRGALANALASSRTRPSTRHLELCVRTPAAGERILRAEVRPHPAGGDSVLLALTDITAQRRSEAELARAREMLAEAESARMAQAAAEMANRSKTAFLARMSHDLRTPLNAVLGFSELLQLNRAAMALPDVATQVHHIHHAGEHLLAMIDEVLDLTRIESGEMQVSMERVALGALLDGCMTLVAPLAAARGVTVHLPASGPDQDVFADPTRLRQVLMNLFSNAVKYNREGGSIEVSLHADADRIAMAVRDTGYGLAPEQVGQLFQPFNRLGAEQRGIEGTGLGLVIAKQLVEAMGGALEARSTPGAGSVFTVHLRRAEGSGAHAAPVQSAVGVRQADVGARPFVVLYVEDNPVNVVLMSAALALREQVRVEVASDGQAGLDMARELRPDLVLLDMDLPVMDGLTVLHHLKSDAALAHIPCVAVSANAMDADIKQALGAGFSDYVVKPFAMQRLLAMLDGFMSARPPAA